MTKETVTVIAPEEPYWQQIKGSPDWLGIGLVPRGFALPGAFTGDEVVHDSLCAGSSADEAYLHANASSSNRSRRTAFRALGPRQVLA